MPSAAEVVRKVLLDEEFVVYPGVSQQPGDGTTQCFTQNLPDDPDDAMCVKDIAGLGFGREMKAGGELRHPGLQIVSRSLGATSGYDTLARVATFLSGIIVRRVVLVRGYYCFLNSVYRTSDLVSLGNERGTNRFLWSLNLRAAMEEVAETPLSPFFRSE